MTSLTAVGIASEVRRLRETYIKSPPQSRLNVISQRLAHASDEVGPTRLTTVVSAVEGLARSIILHHGQPSVLEVQARYKVWWRRSAEELVESVLALSGQSEASVYFSHDWPLFECAVAARNLVVHECTYLGQDKFVPIIRATELIFTEIVKLSGLDLKNR